MDTNAIVTTREDMDVMQWKATTLFQSGLLPSHIKNANQIIAIDMMARELNIPTWQAINGINVIQGKPTVSPQLMLALIERSGKLEDIEIDSTKDGATVTMKRRGRSPHTETFSIQDAQAMQLSGKDNYRKQPAVMLKWRAISACARVVFPDVLMGMYTTEEIAPDTVRVDAEGDFEVIEGARENGTPANITDINKVRQTLGSGDPTKERRIPQRDVVATDGSSALQPASVESADLLNAWASKTTIGDFGYGVRDATGVENLQPSDIARLGLGATNDTQFYNYKLWNEAYATMGAAIAAVKAAFEAEMTAKPATPAKDTQGQAPQKSASTGETEAVVTSAMYHKESGKSAAYLMFNLGQDSGGEIVRCYGRTTTFRAMVGDAYYLANQFEQMENKGMVDKWHTIEPLQITWEHKHSAKPDGEITADYLLLTNAKPVVSAAEAALFGEPPSIEGSF